MVKPARKVVHRSPSHTVRLLHLRHLQAEPIEAESAYERDLVHIAALFPHTTHISHQPLKLDLSGATYTPDFLISFADGSRTVVEVKPASKLPRYTRIFELAEQKLAIDDITFLVATEKQIHGQKRQENALLLRRYGKQMLDAETTARLLEVVGAHHEGIRIEQLQTQFGFTFPQVATGVCTHLICTAPSLATDASDFVYPVRSVEGERHALCFATWLNHPNR